MSMPQLGTEDFEALFERWNKLCESLDAADDMYAPPATEIAAAKIVLAWKRAQYWRVAVDSAPALEGVLTHEGVSLQACTFASTVHDGVPTLQKN
jgi:hypothetical protein